MKGKTIFSKEEAERIRLLIKKKETASRNEQKILQNKIRKLGFYYSDFSDKKGYTVEDFNDLIRRGHIVIAEKEYEVSKDYHLNIKIWNIILAALFIIANLIIFKNEVIYNKESILFWITYIVIYYVLPAGYLILVSEGRKRYKLFEIEKFNYFMDQLRRQNDKKFEFPHDPYNLLNESIRISSSKDFERIYYFTLTLYYLGIIGLLILV